MFITLDINGRSEVYCLERYLEKEYNRIKDLEALVEATPLRCRLRLT